MRVDQWSDTLTIDGINLGVWDEVTGGEADSNDTKYRPGGMAQERSLGGPPTVANLVLRKLLDLTTGDWNTLKNLIAKGRQGKAPAVVGRTPLDEDGHTAGVPLVYQGKLKTIKPPESNSTGTGPAQWEITVSVASNVS